RADQTLLHRRPARRHVPAEGPPLWGPGFSRTPPSLKDALLSGTKAMPDDPQRPALTPGTDLGDYRIDSPLGAGGMGEVYRAHDRKLGRDVAIKMLSSGVRGDAELLKRLQQEARMLAALNHPNIGAIHDLEH